MKFPTSGESQLKAEYVPEFAVVELLEDEFPLAIADESHNLYDLRTGALSGNRYELMMAT